MDYEAEDNVLTDFVFNTMMGFDFSLMLPESKQELADELSEALDSIEEDALDALAETYIADAIEGEFPPLKCPSLRAPIPFAWP